MMKGNKIVLKAPEGITFKVQEEKDGVIVIEAMYESSEEAASEYNYKNPIIPEGFTHVCGEWNNGFTIRNESDGSDFVWIPVGFLEADGTHDGKNFDQQFGRRYLYSCMLFHKDIDQEMLESINKYGGFYISAYLASEENGKLVFKKGNMPWVNINQLNSKIAVEKYSDGNRNIVTCLPSEAVYDTIFKWIIQTGEKTFHEVVIDSKTWGNYWNTKNSPKKVRPTGSKENWKVLGIYDLAGNCSEWCAGLDDDGYGVQRGGSYGDYGKYGPAARHNYKLPNDECDFTSFRAVIYVK